MASTADHPPAPGGHGRLYFRSQPLDTHGGNPASLVHPLGRASSSSGGSAHRQRPYHANPLDQHECFGAYDPHDRRPPPFDEHPTDLQDCRDGASVAGGLSASMPPPPPDRRTGSGVYSPSIVRLPLPEPAPDRHMSRGTFRRGSDISPAQSPRTGSAEGERYREHRRRRDRDESSSSPRLQSPHRGSSSRSLTSSQRHRLEDGRKESKSLPSSKRYRLEEGRKGSSSGGHQYYDDDDEPGGSRGRYGGGRRNKELTYASSYDQDQEHHYLGGTQRNFSLRYPGKRSLSVQQQSSPKKLPLPQPVEISPWDDGYKSPSSPTYCCEDELDIPGDSHVDNQDDSPDIAGREPYFQYEDPLLMTKEKESAYGTLVDDFMDAVSKNWRKPVSCSVGMDEDADQKQTNRFAELALKRYNKNKNNKVKYALVEAVAGGAIFEGCQLYGHVNFYAKAKNGPKKNDGKVLVFAELHHIGRRQNAMVLNCFRVLDENNQSCGRRDQVRSSRIIQDEDMSHCYACTERIKHPDGSCYKAGHFVHTLCYGY